MSKNMAQQVVAGLVIVVGKKKLTLKYQCIVATYRLKLLFIRMLLISFLRIKSFFFLFCCFFPFI